MNISSTTPLAIFFTEEEESQIIFGSKDYQIRHEKLQNRMNKDDIDYAVFYGNREFFSNVEYFCGYDCRFEDALYIMSKQGNHHILVGNEGVAFAKKIPFSINIQRYQNFSLQGQMKDNLRDLKEILREIGLSADTKIGLIGQKFFETDRFGDPAFIFDVPNYIVEDIREISGKKRVINYTSAITGLPDGVRMRLDTAKEIAWAEAAATVSTNAVLRMLKQLKPGLTSRVLSTYVTVPLEPVSVHPMINFGYENVGYGLTSPDETPLTLGEPCGICYGVRGSLTSRVGVAAYDYQSCAQDLQPYMDSFYKTHWGAMASWYETICVGCTGGDLHQAVHGLESVKDNGILLNCGHNIGTDEWSNSPSYEGSTVPIVSGAHMQVDIISSGVNPSRTAICEDGIVIADESLRQKVADEYPKVYARILERQKNMRDVLGIQIHDDVLLLSNLNGVYFPYMLNMGEIFTKQ